MLYRVGVQSGSKMSVSQVTIGYVFVTHLLAKAKPYDWLSLNFAFH